MRHINVLKAIKHDQGFTILELLTVVVIVGILGALSGPSFLAWNQRKQADAAVTNIEGAIKEAQRQAMSKSRVCNITFSTTNPPKATSNNNCLLTGDRTLENVSLTPSSTTMSFNHQGETTTEVTITVTHKGNTNLKRCLVVSSPLGLIRKGENPVSGVCNP